MNDKTNDKTLKKISIFTVILAILLSSGGCLVTTSAVTGNDGIETVEEADTGCAGEPEECVQSYDDAGREVSRKNAEEEGRNEKEEDVIGKERITKEYHFCVGSLEDVDIPTEITVQGKTYEISGEPKYKELNEVEAVKQIVNVSVENESDLDRSISYKSPATGITYLLKTPEDAIRWGNKTTIGKKITETVEWGPSMEAPAIPGRKAITYYNPVTGQNETTSGKLVGTKVSEPFWSAAEEPIQGIFARSEGGVTAYTTDYILPDGTAFVVPVDMDQSLHPSWEGYEKDILKILGLDSSLYRITGAGWAGDSYYSVECDERFGMNVAVAYRNAVYPYEALCRTYTAVYEADIETQGYKTAVTYYLPYEELKDHYSKEELGPDLSTVYDVSVKASYRAKNIP
ncbi:MAG: hypothetical protein IJH82_08805 [Lachnospiraceae bacterium]|nr:hypothetical protein [Lachnospiraceae bacterium]